MKSLPRTFARVALLLAFVLVLGVSLPGSSQWPMPAPVTPDAQRSAINSVKSQVGWLQNATRTAPNFGQGYDSVLQAFQHLQQGFNGFKQTLTPQQLAAGANNLAELDAGLNILQEAFSYYQQDIADGQAVGAALRDMGQVLRQGSNLWLQEFLKTCSRLRVGWG